MDVDLGEEQASRLLQRRIKAQGELNPLVSAMGAADSGTAQKMVAAATAKGFVMPTPTFIDAIAGKGPPQDDVSDPMLLPGLMYQRSVADADAADRCVEDTGRER